MRPILILFLYLLIYPSYFQGQNNIYTSEVQNSEFIDSDIIFSQFQKDKINKLKEGDTIGAINSIIEISNRYSAIGNYSQSYDGYWEALIYSDAISDSTYLTNIYRKLGTLYSIFRREEKAEKYFKLSLDVARRLNTSKEKQLLKLNETYQIMASHNIELGNYGLAQKYLDSCFNIYQKTSKTELSIIEAKQSYLYYHLGKYDKALGLLIANEEYFINNQPSYLVIFYSFLGDTYFKKDDYIKAEYYYLKAIEYSKKYRSHSNFVPNLYQKLGDLYFKTNKKDKAFVNLQISKDLTESFFGIRSNTNIDILEIKDAFRIETERQKKDLEVAKLNRLEQQQTTLFFRNIALTVSFISLILISGISMLYLYKRRKSEKTEFLKRQKLNREKNDEIFALKNRELTSSALQLIQKDALILEIKDTLKANNYSNDNDIKAILTKIKINKNFDWKEFNARFTSVNKHFYKGLSDKFPELTRRDRRLCALIKLNFSSKEISQLLGISPLSVNTSRYRLRKKMSLKKEEDLFDVISTI